ncbi:MAG: hypothetical protein LBR77_06860 [Lachnospiraceae bacterium]|nr:hypothetical protein [Lachnospiraceae bacterium]
MKKLFLFLLALAMLLNLAACGQQSAAPNQTQGADSAQETSGGTASGTDKKIVSAGSPGAYWDRLQDEWENADEEGYVWTITINGVETLDVMGIAYVDYGLALSCSHVGTDLFGAYSGEMAFRFNGDLSVLARVATMYGGTMEYDAAGWFKNEQFLMDLSDYDPFIDAIYPETMVPDKNEGPVDEAVSDAVADAFIEAYLGDVGSGTKDFEIDEIPVAEWLDWDFHMTEGDMGQYMKLTGIMNGTVDAYAASDSAGENVISSGTADINLISDTGILNIVNERYADQEKIEIPFPYTIKAYDTGDVVFELFSSQGGPVTVKFYGTIDKVPVEETTLVKARSPVDVPDLPVRESLAETASSQASEKVRAQMEKYGLAGVAFPVGGNASVMNFPDAEGNALIWVENVADDAAFQAFVSDIFDALSAQGVVESDYHADGGEIISSYQQGGSEHEYDFWGVNASVGIEYDAADALIVLRLYPRR